MRKLASIQKIVELSPIPNSDNIEKAKVLGWELIVKKGEFQKGDFCVYFEIDSLLPKENPAFLFMAKAKYRVKTITLRGQISQGLALPVSSFPEIAPFVIEGKDVTELLKIEKYEKEEEGGDNFDIPLKKRWYSPYMKYPWFRKVAMFFIAPKKKGGFPTQIISKSDETRVQTIPSIFKEYENSLFTETEKIEGQSASYILERKGFMGWLREYYVCSRELRRVHKDNSTWWQISTKFDIENVLKKIMAEYPAKSWAIQGEIVGPSIQGNIYGLSELDLYVYRLKRTDYDGLVTFFRPCDGKNFLSKYGLKWVPIVGSIRLGDFTVDSLLKHVDGPSKLNNTLREGSVFVLNDCSVSPFSFKAVSNQYLLKKSKKETE